MRAWTANGGLEAYRGFGRFLVRVVRFLVLRDAALGAKRGLLDRTAFRESRLAVAILGFAAVAFGSPLLLDIAPDILAVAIAGAGYADGIAVGSSRRRSRIARRYPAGQTPAEGLQ